MKKGAGAKKVREETWLAALVEKDGRFLVHRNERKGLLRGLWQFPVLVSTPGAATGTKALGKFLLEEFGIRVKTKASLPGISYGFTHIQARIEPHLCSFVRAAPSRRSPEPLRWVSLRAFARYPVSTLMRKVAALLPRS